MSYNSGRSYEQNALPDETNRPTRASRCPHGRAIQYFDAFSYAEAERIAQITDFPDHPLPPFCHCCGNPCASGKTRCFTCQPTEVV